jgi:cell division protein FtsL
MIRLNLMLLVAVLVSAVYLVSVQYDSRRLFAELDKARSESKRLATEFDRLQVEKRAQATPSRVERIAREKLEMRQATPAITMYVNYSGTASPNSGASQPSAANGKGVAP